MWEESFSAFLRCLSSSQIASNPGFFPDDAEYKIIFYCTNDNNMATGRNTNKTSFLAIRIMFEVNT